MSATKIVAAMQVRIFLIPLLLAEQLFDGAILERVYNQIAKADPIIAEMTGRNPNVFYEVGYAYALGKRVILLTQKSSDIPFDLKHYLHLVYDGKLTILEDRRSEEGERLAGGAPLSKRRIESPGVGTSLAQRARSNI